MFWVLLIGFGSLAVCDHLGTVHLSRLENMVFTMGLIIIGLLTDICNGQSKERESES